MDIGNKVLVHLSSIIFRYRFGLAFLISGSFKIERENIDGLLTVQNGV